MLTLLEAHADFRDRGMAALRRDEDGNITLDRGLRFSGDRKLRVQVFQHGRVIGCNRLSRPVVGDSEEAIEEDFVEDEIRQARDSLFDEELHAELHREARHLINQGVTCIDDVIHMPFELDKSIQIDLVDSDDPVPIDLEEDDIIPNGISITLHILLSHAHHQNLRRRSRPPLPLTEGKPQGRCISSSSLSLSNCDIEQTSRPVAISSPVWLGPCKPQALFSGLKKPLQRQ